MLHAVLSPGGWTIGTGQWAWAMPTELTSPASRPPYPPWPRQPPNPPRLPYRPGTGLVLCLAGERDRQTRPGLIPEGKDNALPGIQPGCPVADADGRRCCVAGGGGDGEFGMSEAD